MLIPAKVGILFQKPIFLTYMLHFLCKVFWKNAVLLEINFFVFYSLVFIRHQNVIKFFFFVFFYVSVTMNTHSFQNYFPPKGSHKMSLQPICNRRVSLCGRSWLIPSHLCYLRGDVEKSLVLLPSRILAKPQNSFFVFFIISIFFKLFLVRLRTFQLL